jgi:hypothetical protein
MIKYIQGKPIDEWRQWLSKEINEPCKNVMDNPHVLQVLRAFKETIDRAIISRVLLDYINE